MKLVRWLLDALRPEPLMQNALEDLARKMEKERRAKEVDNHGFDQSR